MNTEAFKVIFIIRNGEDNLGRAFVIGFERGKHIAFERIGAGKYTVAILACLFPLWCTGIYFGIQIEFGQQCITHIAGGHIFVV